MEFLDVVDENDVVIGKKLSHEVIAKGLCHRSAQVLIFNDEGKFLGQLRAKEKKLFPDMWANSAAGCIRAGEDPDVGAARELKEELGIEVAVRPHDWKTTHAYPDQNVHIRFHRCSILKGRPKSNDGQEIRWVKPEGLKRYTFPPADRAVIAQLARARFVDPQA